MMRRRMVMLAFVAVVACDIPTEAPRWEQTWVVPGETVTISVADLLPVDVALSDDRSAFRALTNRVEIWETLAGMCPACAPFQGLVAPKPEFTATLWSAATLSQDVVTAMLAGGALDAVLEHNLSFDPLRPSSDPSQRGHLVVEVTSNGEVIAIDSISGHDTAFPAGTPLIPSLPVAPVPVSSELEVEVRIWSPTGDPVLITTSDTLGFLMTESEVYVSQVTIQATALDIRPTATALDFGVDEETLERVESGAVRVVIVNPFDVVGTLNVAFDVGAQPVERELVLAPGESSQRVEYSGAEMRAILGSPTVDLITSGAVGSATGTVTLTPAQEMMVDIRFELVIRIGPRADS